LTLEQFRVDVVSLKSRHPELRQTKRAFSSARE
jgi:hypothetical protein